MSVILLSKIPSSRTDVLQWPRNAKDLFDRSNKTRLDPIIVKDLSLVDQSLEVLSLEVLDTAKLLKNDGSKELGRCAPTFVLLFEYLRSLPKLDRKLSLKMRPPRPFP